MNFNYIPLHASTKIPLHKDWANKYQTVKPKGNYGVLTGKINNIIIVDIDIKDNGLEKWNELIELHDEPDTYTIETGSGGFHYYFNYNDVIKNIIKLKIDGISTGIDILTDGKFAVGAGSVHPKTNIKYKLHTNAPICDMPDWLLGLIVSNHNVKKVIKKVDDKPLVEQTTIKIFEEIPDAKFKELLSLLPAEYSDDYTKWLQITAVCKNHNKKDEWSSWCKKSKKYDKNNNNKIWNTLTMNTDINYLCHLTESKPIKFTYDYTPITDTKDMFRMEQNNRYLNIEDIQHDTIIVKSDTGTGKTTSVCKMLKDEERILSIVSRCSLVTQHIQSFAKVDVKIIDYTSENIYKENKICCQIDSIIKLNISEIDKYCVYLDEVNSTINYLLNSTTLMNRRDKVFKTFAYIIKNCKRLICSDADISDIVFEFVNNYRKPEETVYIDNIFKNYNNIPAIHYNDIDEMVGKMKKIITRNKRGFVATFDSLKTMNRIYELLYVENQREKFIKISSEDDDFKNTDWDGKFVFFTPKIVYGIDYVPVNQSVNVFVFSSGGSIDPLQIAQQATRCRKIKKLHYNMLVTTRFPKYNSYDDCKSYIMKNLEQFTDKLEGIYLNDDLEYTIRECIFNKLYLYSCFTHDIITSNYKYHFDNILIKKGFVLSTVGKVHMMDKVQKKELDELVDAKRDELITKIINHEPIEDREQYLKAINTRIYELLKLSDDDEMMGSVDYADNMKFILTRYKKYIFDNKVLQEHFRTCKLLFKDKLIFNTFNGIHRKDFNIKHMDTAEAKIFMIMKLEQLLTINRYKINEIDYSRVNEEVNWTEEDHKLYKHIFNSRCKYSNNYYALYKMLGASITNLSPSIITNNAIDITKYGMRLRTSYKIDLDNIRKDVELYGYRDKNLIKIDNALLEMFGITPDVDMDGFIE
jgi:hypothetical protein